MGRLPDDIGQGHDIRTQHRSGCHRLYGYGLKGRTSIDGSSLSVRSGCLRLRGRAHFGLLIRFRGTWEVGTFRSRFRLISIVFNTLHSIDRGRRSVKSRRSTRSGGSVGYESSVSVFSFTFETVQAIDHGFDPIKKSTGLRCEFD